jgi:hypothetical protein
MTGRGAGYCVVDVSQGSATPLLGKDRRTSFGGGRHGWRNRYRATGVPGWMRAGDSLAVPELQVTALKNESAQLKDQLDAIDRRIQELEHD